MDMVAGRVTDRQAGKQKDQQTGKQRKTQRNRQSKRARLFYVSWSWCSWRWVAGEERRSVERRLAPASPHRTSVYLFEK